MNLTIGAGGLTVGSMMAQGKCEGGLYAPPPPAAAPADQGGTLQALSRVVVELDRLDSALAAHSERIGIVLLPDQPGTDSGGSAPNKQTCQLAAAINEIAARIRNAQDRLSYMTSRIDL